MACAWGTEWVTGMNSTGQRADVDRGAVGDLAHVGLGEQAGFLDAVAGEAEREGGAVDRQRLVAQVADAVVVTQQVLDRADVVFVAVGEHQRRDPLARSRAGR